MSDSGGCSYHDVLRELEKIEAYVYATRQTLKENSGKFSALRNAGLASGQSLRPYQQQGVQWIISLYENGLNGILADEMGLGKTVQVISSFAALVAGGAKGPFLVVAPMSVLHSWAEQMDVFAPGLPRLIYYGTDDERVALREQITRVQCFTGTEFTEQSHQDEEEKENHTQRKPESTVCSLTAQKSDPYPHLHSLISEVLAKPSPHSVPFLKQTSAQVPVTPQPPMQHSQFTGKPIVVTAGRNDSRTNPSTSLNVKWRAGMLSIVSFLSTNQPPSPAPELTHLNEILDSVISQSHFNVKKDYRRFIAKADWADVYFQAIYSSQPPTASAPESAAAPHRKRQRKDRLLAKPSEDCALRASKNAFEILPGKLFEEKCSEETPALPSTGSIAKMISVKPLNSHQLEKVSSKVAWRHLEDVISGVLSTTDDDMSEHEAGALGREVDMLNSLNESCGTTVGACPAEAEEPKGAAIVAGPVSPTSEADLKSVYAPLDACRDEEREDKSPVEQVPSIVQCESSPAAKPEALSSDVCGDGVRSKDALICPPPPTGENETSSLFPTTLPPLLSFQEKSVDSSTARQSPRAQQASLLTKCVLPTLEPKVEDPSLLPDSVKDGKENAGKTGGFECSPGDAANNPEHSEENKPSGCLSSPKNLKILPAGEQSLSAWEELKNSSREKPSEFSLKLDRSFGSSPIRQLVASRQSNYSSKGEIVDECVIGMKLERLKYEENTSVLYESDLSRKCKELSAADESAVTTDDSGIDIHQSPNQGKSELASDKIVLGVQREFVSSFSSPQRESSLLKCPADTSDSESSKTPQTAESGCFPVVLTTYEVAIRDASFLERINFKALVVDEAQRIKRASSKLFQCLKEFDADIRLVVTGTPLQNNISELWSLLHFVLPEIFSLGTDFSVWFDPLGLVEQVGRDRLAAQEAEHALVTNLRKVIRPFMLRRTKIEANVFLPPKREVVLRVAMAPLQKTLYEFVTDKLRKEGVLFVPKKQPGGSITKLDERNILPQRRRSVPRIVTNENIAVSSSDEKPKIEAKVKSQSKRRVGRPRKVQPPTAFEDLDSGAYSSSAANSDFDNFTPKAAKPPENPHNFEFLPDVMRSNRLMLLRRIVNHPYLAIEAPDGFYSSPSSQSSSQEEEKLDEVVSSTRLELLLGASGKMHLLDRLLQELITDGHKTLIFSQFTMALDIIEELLKVRKWEWVRLDGAMRFETRQTAVHRFNTTTAAELPIFLLSTRAGGLGLNLQAAADTVIIHDSDWNPQLDLQAQDRCHRIGQEKPVLVLRLLSAGTIEEAIYARALAKRGLERLLLHKNTSSAGSTDVLECNGSVLDESELATMASRSTFEAHQAAGKEHSDSASPGPKDTFDLMQLLKPPEQEAEPTIDAELISDAELKRILSRDFNDQQTLEANTGEKNSEPTESMSSITDSPALTTQDRDDNNSDESELQPNEAKSEVSEINRYSGRRRHHISVNPITEDESDLDAKSQSSRNMSPIAKLRGRPSAKRPRVDTSPETQVSSDSSNRGRAPECNRSDSTSDVLQESPRVAASSTCSDEKNPSAQPLRRSLRRSPITNLFGPSRLRTGTVEPVTASTVVNRSTASAPRRGLPTARRNVTTPVGQRLLRSGLTRPPSSSSKQPKSCISMLERVGTTKAPLGHASLSPVAPPKSSTPADLKNRVNCDFAASRCSRVSTGAPSNASPFATPNGLRHCPGLRRSLINPDKDASVHDKPVLFAKFKPPALRSGPKQAKRSSPRLRSKVLVDEIEE